jgi:hypothetical protein
LYSELSEEMEDIHGQNEYRKNYKTNVTLLFKRTKISLMSDEEVRGKYETITGHLA